MSLEGGAAAPWPCWLLAVALCAAALVPPGRVAAEDYGPDLEAYLLLIERYQSGDAEGPVRVAGSWGPIWIRSTVRRLLDWCKGAPGDATASHVRVAQGAFLLHTHAALAEHSLGLGASAHDEHVEAAHELLRWFRERYREGTWPREARG